MLRGTSLTLILALTPLTQGQEVYPIKLKEAARGDVRRSDVSSNTEIINKLVGTTGKVLQEKKLQNAQQSVYRETVLEKPAGSRLPTRLRRDYEKAVLWVEGKPEALPYQGKTILIEDKGGAVHFQVEGGAALTGLAAALLDRELNKVDLRELMLPKNAVRVGEAWKIDMAPVAAAWEKMTAMQVDVARSTGSGRLTRACAKDGRRFGALTFRLEMPIAALGGEKKIKADDSSKLTMDVALDCCIDGSASTGTLQASFQVQTSAAVPTPDGQPAHVVVSSRGTLREVRTELPPFQGTPNKNQIRNPK